MASIIQRTGRASGTTDATSWNAGTVGDTSQLDVGDRVIAFVAIDGNGVPSTTSTGWSRVMYGAEGSGAVTGAVFLADITVADTLADLVVANTQSQQFAVMFVHCRPGAGKTFSGIYVGGILTNATSTNSDPGAATLALGEGEPSLGGDQNWLCLVGRMGDSTVVATGAPTGFSNLTSQAGGGTSGASVSVADAVQTYPEVFQTTPLDPDVGDWYEYGPYNPPAFTSASENWVAAHVIVAELPLPIVYATANNLTTGSPALGSPALTQTHAITGNNLAASAPVLGSPALTQAHAIAGNNLAVSAPALGSPAVTQRHSLTASNLAASAPALASAALTQGHALVANNLATASPVLGSPALTVVIMPVANALSTSSPSLGTPSLSQSHSVTGSNLATAPPALASPALTQRHSLTASNLAASSPVLGTPALTFTYAFTANNLATSSPVLGTPTITQTHVLAASNLAPAAPVLGSPAVTQKQSLTASNLATSSPALASPALTQTHPLTANNLATSSPVLGSPTLTQGHSLTANNLATSSPVLGTPTAVRILTELKTVAPATVEANPDGWSDQTGSTSGAAIVAAVDEAVASDADYAQSPEGLANSTVRFKLDPLTAASIHRGGVLRYRLERVGGDAGFTQTVRLYQGGGATVGAGTLIGGPYVHNDTAFTTYAQDIPAASITNGNDLYVEVEAA